MPPKHAELVAKREDFSLERRPGSEPRDDRKEQHAEERSHAAMLSASTRIDTLPWSDEVFGRHNSSGRNVTSERAAATLVD